MSTPPRSPPPPWEKILDAFCDDVGKRSFVPTCLFAFDAGMRLAECHPTLIQGLLAHCVPVEGLEILAFEVSGLGVRGGADHHPTSVFGFWEDLPPKHLVPFIPDGEAESARFWFRFAIAMGTAATRHGFSVLPGLIEENKECNLWLRMPYWNLLRRYLVRRIELLAVENGAIEDPRPLIVRLIEFGFPRPDMEREILSRYALAAWHLFEKEGKHKFDPRAWARIGFLQGYAFASREKEACRRLLCSVAPGVLPLQRKLDRQFMPKGANTPAKAEKAVAQAAQRCYEGRAQEFHLKLADFIRDYYDFGFWTGIVRARKKPRSARPGTRP